METSITRICSKCKETKTLDCFYGKDGYCKPCRAIVSRDWYRNNPEKSKKINYDKYWKDVEKSREKSRVEAKKWRENHPEQFKEQMKEYRGTHRDDARKRAKIWREEHRDRFLENLKNWYKENFHKVKKWQKENVEKVREYSRTRRAKKIANGGKITTKEWLEICHKYGDKCLRCGRMDIKLTMDHVIPLSLGGTHTVDNVQPLCLSCNSSKHDTIADYRNDKI